MRKKYPKTPHLSFSNNVDKSDNVLSEAESLKRVNSPEIVVTEKMDGENITIYKYSWHVRSLDSKTKSYHSYFLNRILPRIQSIIPEGIVIHGEYMYPTHSIYYDNLESYFYIFAVETYEGEFLSWEETEEWARLLGFPTPQVLASGKLDLSLLIKSVESSGKEGFVLRNKNKFPYSLFKENVSKYVCKNHTKTSENWTGKEKNLLKK